MARGFTLIEVMVAVVIVAVLASIVVVNAMPDDAALARREGRRLAALLELAFAEARASGQSLAWLPEGNGYSFWRRNEDGEWGRFPESSVYRPRSIGASAEIRNVMVDARVLPPGERVELSPYGGGGAIEATIVGGDARITLRGNVLGHVSLHNNSGQRSE